jgi:hypothetical protein
MVPITELILFTVKMLNQTATFKSLVGVMQGILYSYGIGYLLQTI